MQVRSLRGHRGPGAECTTPDCVQPVLSRPSPLIQEPVLERGDKVVAACAGASAAPLALTFGRWLARAQIPRTPRARGVSASCGTIGCGKRRRWEKTWQTRRTRSRGRRRCLATWTRRARARRQRGQRRARGRARRSSTACSTSMPTATTPSTTRPSPMPSSTACFASCRPSRPCIPSSSRPTPTPSAWAATSPSSSSRCAMPSACTRSMTR